MRLLWVRMLLPACLVFLCAAGASMALTQSEPATPPDNPQWPVIGDGGRNNASESARRGARGEAFTLSFDQEDMQAYYFYGEPNGFGLHPVTVTATDDFGLAQTATELIEGQAGAKGFLIATDGASKISSITISNSKGMDFAIGEFGWAKTIPAPGALALLGLSGLIGGRRRS